MSLGTLIASSPLLFAHSFGFGSNHREASLDSRVSFSRRGHGRRFNAAQNSRSGMQLRLQGSSHRRLCHSLHQLRTQLFFFPMDLTMTTHGLHSRITYGAILMKRAEPVNCRRRVHLTLAAGELLSYVIYILLALGVDLFFTDAGRLEPLDAWVHSSSREGGPSAALSVEGFQPLYRIGVHASS
ncbi:hypothetical protein H4582DRAFT_1520405 [Lactarius indigo]|nr:hypothetical protein H4582DRAFT_1520405 [Lactarius indigo]